MKLLALDTATESCSVALRIGDEVRVRRHPGARQQTAVVLPLVQALLAEAGVTLAQLDAIACTRGPGAFTGVRVAVSVTQGLAFGAGLPAIGVSTLAALAQQAVRVAGAQQVLPLLDARMGELYAGAYAVSSDGALSDDGVVDALQADRLCRPEDVAGAVPAGRAWVAIGSGWVAYPPAQLGVQPASVLTGEPDAEDVLALAVRAWRRGEAQPAEQLQPVYLRDTVAWKKLDEQARR